MATLKTMNRRRRRKLEPGIVISVFESRGDRLCSFYERHQGRHIRRVSVRGEPYMVCSEAMSPTSQDDINWDAFQWD